MNGNLTVYKASAGSGKTFTLATRCIALLLAAPASSYRHILAVTFTNKATAEMKERILGQLFGLSRGLPSSADYLNTVRPALPGLSDEEIRQRAADVLRRIVHDYDRFRVTTIDSFFQSVVTNMAHELGLSANFRVDINDTDVIDQAVDRLMAGLQPNTAVLRWVISYIHERIDDNRRWDITREVKRLARNLLRERYLMLENLLRDALSDEERLNGFRQRLREQDEAAADHMESAARYLEEVMEEHGLGFEAFSRGSALATYLHKLVDRLPDAPSATVEAYLSNPEKWLRKADQKRPELVAVCEELRSILETVENFRQEYAQAHSNYVLTTANLGPLRLLGEIGRELTRINEEANRFMLAKVPILLNRLIGSDDAPFVFEKAGTTFLHVMIDEFQDTSTLQWRNFKTLLLENMAAGNSCLLVGDVKQSIYRFRGGDWGILDGIRKEFPHHPVDVQELTTNYRSQQRVIDFNNRFFARAAAILDELSPTEGDDRIARLYADVAQQCAADGDGGYVRVHFTDRRAAGDDNRSADDLRMDDLETQVRLLHAAGLPYSAMAVLVRWNKEAAALIDRFATDCPDVPLVSDEAFLLAASEAVQLLIHAMRYLADPTDTIALAFVARHGNAVAADWAACEGDRPTALAHTEFISRREALLTLPLYELQEELIRLFGLDQRPGQAAYLMAYLDQVLAFLDDNPSDVRLFLEHWNDVLSGVSIPAAEVEGLRVLTIHKSKGLQFHTVLLPFCDWPIERDRPDDLLWCEPEEAPYNELPLVPVPTRSMARDSIYVADYEHEHFQRRIENLNLLYVAFTRAEKNLLVWTKGYASPKGTSTICDLIKKTLGDELDDTFESGSPVTTVVGHRHTDDGNRLTARPEPLGISFHTYPSRVSFRQSNRSQEFIAQAGDPDRRQGEYIDQGILLHKIFSALDTVADVDRVLDSFEAEGLLGEQIKKDSLRRLICRRLSSPQTAQWFDGSWQLFREVAILSRDTEGRLLVRRPDRVMVRNDETVVVDFKFGKQREEHNTQVREYLGLLSDMGRPSPRGFLWYVFTNTVVEVNS